MSITIRFVIEVDPTQHDAIISNLKWAKFEKVESTGNFYDNTPSRSQLQCERNFLDWHQVFIQQNYINNLTGVRKITTLSHEVAKDKQIWYKHWIFPMLLATVINIISILLLVYSLKPDSTLFEYAILAIIPSILSLGSAVGIKVSR